MKNMEEEMMRNGDILGRNGGKWQPNMAAIETGKRRARRGRERGREGDHRWSRRGHRQQPRMAATGTLRADGDGSDGGRKTEAAAEPLRAEKGVMQPMMAATGTLREDGDGRDGGQKGRPSMVATGTKTADGDGCDGDGDKRATIDGRDGDTEGRRLSMDATGTERERGGLGTGDGKITLR